MVWAALAIVTIAISLLGIGGKNLFQRLETGLPSIPGSNSRLADDVLSKNNPQADSIGLIITGVSPNNLALQPPIASAAAKIGAVTNVKHVLHVYMTPLGPADPRVAPLIASNKNGMSVAVNFEAHLSDSDKRHLAQQVVPDLENLAAQIKTIAPAAEMRIGGGPLISAEISQQVEKDLKTGELIALPISLLIIVIVFSGFLAASMPMLGAGAAICVTLGFLYGMSFLTTLDSSVVNVVSILGLGLSIDYGLLMVSRLREELRALAPPSDGVEHEQAAIVAAIGRTCATAGRTIIFSGLTIAIAVASLLFFKAEFIRAMGLASLGVTLIAIVVSLTLVPALMSAFGARLRRPSLLTRVRPLRRMLAGFGDVAPAEGFFSRLAERIQRAPLIVMLVVVAALGTLSVPAFNVEPQNSTLQLLPESSNARQFTQQLAAEYPTFAAPELNVVVARGERESSDAYREAAKTLTSRLEAVPNVVRTTEPKLDGKYIIIGVFVEADRSSAPVVRDVATTIRELDARYWVTGDAARQMDFIASVGETAPLSIGLVLVSTFILLFLMTGSVIVPIKAILMNVISLGATIGVLTAIFQYGHLESLLNFTSPGGLETIVIILIFALGFGLSMDYEVFLLSRIIEAKDSGADDAAAVRIGLQRSGRIITSAAIIIIVVFLGFAAGELLVIKEIGVGLAVAIIVDATLVRCLLVPATMSLLGRANWWAPEWMQKIHRRFGISESGATPELLEHVGQKR